MKKKIAAKKSDDLGVCFTGSIRRSRFWIVVEISQSKFFLCFLILQSVLLRVFRESVGFEKPESIILTVVLTTYI